MTAQTAKPKTFSITVSYILYGTPAKVFSALTDEGIIGQWCDGGGKVEHRVDGAVELFGGWVKGKVLEYDVREKKLSFTWKPQEWDAKTPSSVVDFNFRTHEAGTELTVSHSHFPSQAEADKHKNGWIGLCIRATE